MRKTIFWLLAIGYWLFGSFFVGQVLAEEIKDFSSKIYLNKDGTINVEERILYDFGNLERHGIYREIPFIKKNQEGKKFALEFSNFSVVDERGSPYLFKKTKEGEKIKLKIGNPSKTISGVHSYIISYKVAGALSYFSDHDELYWNVTGNEWSVVINSAKVEVYLPERLDDNRIKLACYTGSYGSKMISCLYRFNNDRGQDGKSIVSFSSERYLLAGEGLTIVLGFPKNIVSVLEPKEYKTFWESFLGKIIVAFFCLVIFIWYVGLPIYIIYRFFKYGRDPKSDVGVVSSWFDPPKTPDGKRFLTPAEVGVLGDETVDLKDISATIVDLARRRYLRIEERKKGEFWLVLCHPEFSSGSIKNEILKQVQNDNRLINEMPKPHYSQSKQVRHNNSLISEQNNLLDFEKLLLNEFFKDAKEFNLRKKTLYQPVEAVKKSIYQEVVKQGLFPEDPEKIRTKMTILAFFGLITGSLFLAFASFIFGRRLPRKTIEGVKAKNIAFSLRNFLKSQERQLSFQADKQFMFEKLLPYAIVFGVERIWAKRFADLQLKPPEWYQAYDQSGFNTVIFTNNLNSSLSSFRSSAAPPTSTRSTSGFSSGFSGGGFSGGGGGGGGGGSW